MEPEALPQRQRPKGIRLSSRGVRSRAFGRELEQNIDRNPEQKNPWASQASLIENGKAPKEQRPDTNHP
ncbi:MAG: hypothetical protein ACP5NX_01845 [Candidatus Bilamarchaeaceae archaeon]